MTELQLHFGSFLCIISAVKILMGAGRYYGMVKLVVLLKMGDILSYLSTNH